MPYAGILSVAMRDTLEKPSRKIANGGAINDRDERCYLFKSIGEETGFLVECHYGGTADTQIILIRRSFFHFLFPNIRRLDPTY